MLEASDYYYIHREKKTIKDDTQQNANHIHHLLINTIYINNQLHEKQYHYPTKQSLYNKKIKKIVVGKNL